LIWSKAAPKDQRKLDRRMAACRWTWRSIQEAHAAGVRFAVTNAETGVPATRYIPPATGPSDVIDDTEGEVIHVGGDGFAY
jgi:hypothetical protein